MNELEKNILRKAHSALIEYKCVLESWSCNRLEERRLITDIPAEIKDLRRIINSFEDTFLYINPDLSEED